MWKEEQCSSPGGLLQKVISQLSEDVTKFTLFMSKNQEWAPAL